MFTYYLSRGLDAVDVLARNFSNRTWFLPDLICDEILDTLKSHSISIEFYSISDKDLQWHEIRVGTDNTPKVVYLIDYFGQETKTGGKESPPNTIIIRDSVWFPYPFSPVEPNQVWFNSLRKIFRGAKGSSLISPYRISGLNEVPNIFKHSSLTWWEMNKRFENYHLCKEIFDKYALSINQQFPSVFPIRLKNRDEILEQLDTPLPGMWANKYKLPSPLYAELTFIPLDSRFDRARLTLLANRINELVVA